MKEQATKGNKLKQVSDVLARKIPFTKQRTPKAEIQSCSPTYFGDRYSHSHRVNKPRIPSTPQCPGGVSKLIPGLPIPGNRPTSGKPQGPHHIEMSKINFFSWSQSGVFKVHCSTYNDEVDSTFSAELGSEERINKTIKNKTRIHLSIRNTQPEKEAE